MATKTGTPETEKVDVEESLDYLDKTMERLKTLYEQYFLGMQKQPPAHIHNDVERRIREMMQVQIRNTGLRYRFATLQQKFGSYNSYWRRTLRQIEQGTYLRQLSKISRKAAASGEEIPEEILAAMPKRMREQVKRDREQALAIRARHQRDAKDGGDDVDVDIDVADDGDASPAVIGESNMVRNAVRKNQHVLSEADADLDFEAFFASVSDDTNPDAKPYSVEQDDEPTGASGGPPARPTAPARPAPPQAARPPAPPPAPPPRPSQPPQRPSQPLQPDGQRPGLPRAASVQPPAPPQRQTLPSQRDSQASQPVPRVQSRPPAPAVPPPPVQRPRFVEPQRAGTMPGVAPAATPHVPTTRMPTAPSQVTRPNPIAPGSSQQRPAVPVESMQGPFPRAPTPPARPTPRPEPAPAPMRPPPGMNDADVNALYAKYVKAKQAVGEDAGPGAYGKLLKTINAQAPKIMAEYRATGVEFSVVVKDNQVIIKAKPKP